MKDAFDYMNGPEGERLEDALLEDDDDQYFVDMSWQCERCGAFIDSEGCPCVFEDEL